MTGRFINKPNFVEENTGDNSCRLLVERNILGNLFTKVTGNP
jgi:hypothetical protein